VVLGIIVAMLAVAAVGALVLRSPLLDVESVEVAGVVADRAAAVRQAAGVSVGDPVLGVFPGRVAGRVEELAWVEDAQVTRSLSGDVAIDVVPRTPVGWVTAGNRTLVVDAEGTVIEKVAAPPAGVPELVGVADLAPVGGHIAPAVLPGAAGALGTELRLRIAAVVLDDGAVSAQVGFGPQLRFGTPDRMEVKARVAAAVLASLGATTVTYVDVSVPAAPVSG
jgi:cell division protein FtsQ